uniref:Uncharacterized protein n=1 Tax=Caenorhabditis japonica TaxID=281687 RepID=A0A8R1DPW9_CAEJA
MLMSTLKRRKETASPPLICSMESPKTLPTTPETFKEMKHQAERIEKTLALEAEEEKEESLIAAIKVQFPDQTRQWSQQGGCRQWQD